MDHQLLSLPIVLSFVVFIFMSIKIWFKSSTTSKASNSPLPPGPRKLPFIGNLHLMICSLPHHRLRDLANKYGPLMHLQLGEIPTVIVSSPEMASQVMKTHDINFVNRPYFLTSEILFYNSKNIATAPYGDYWRQMRKIVSAELLNIKRVRQMESIRDHEVSKFIKTISSKQGTRINLTRMLPSLNYDLISQAVFGGISEKRIELIPLLQEVVDVFASINLADMFPSVKLFRVTSKMRPRLERLHHEIDKVLQHIIDEHRMQKVETDTSNGFATTGFIDTFLHLKEHGDLKLPLTLDDIKAVVLDIFTASVDTSSITIEWVMSELIKNSGQIKKAQAEVRGLIDKKQGRIDEADIEQLKYMKLVIKETMRLHPPLPFLLPRISSERCEINGYEIAANTQVMVNVWAIARDPNSWTEPEKFYPERFLDGSIDYKGNNFEFTPFGAGRRMCPGLPLGIANVEVILANLLYHFDWILPDNKKPEDLDMTERFGASTSRKYDLCLLPIPYKNSPVL